MRENWIDRAVDLIAAAMVISVAAALASLTWRLSGDHGGRGSVAIAGDATAPPPVDLAPILRLAPFGKRVVAAAAAQAPASLGLELRGIVLARPHSASVALIAAGSAPPGTFGIGAALPGGAVIDSIEYDLVVLRVGAELQALSFGDEAAAPSNASPGAAAPRSARGADVAALRALIPPEAAGIPVEPIEAIRQRLDGGASALLDSLGATATPRGYAIGAELSPQLQQAGLRPGDIIERVNGVTVGDAERDRRLFEAAVAAGQARVELLRDGRRVTLSFPLR